MSDHDAAEPSKPPLTISSVPEVALLTVTFTTALEPTLPAASNALDWRPWPPFATVVVFHDDRVRRGRVGADQPAVDVELDAGDPDVVAAFAATVTVPLTVAPPAVSVIDVVGGVVSPPQPPPKSE